MDKSDLQRCNATDTTPMDSKEEHQVLENDHAYSTVYDMQQQMFATSDNPAYSKGSKHSQRPVQQCDDHGR